MGCYQWLPQDTADLLSAEQTRNKELSEANALLERQLRDATEQLAARASDLAARTELQKQVPCREI